MTIYNYNYSILVCYHEPADDHGLVHAEGGHQELRGLGQEHQQGQHEGGHREQRGHPHQLRDLAAENGKCWEFCGMIQYLSMRDILVELEHEHDEEAEVDEHDEDDAGLEGGGGGVAEAVLQVVGLGELSLPGGVAQLQLAPALILPGSGGHFVFILNWKIFAYCILKHNTTHTPNA